MTDFWFGTLYGNLAQMQYVKCALTGMGAGRSGFKELQEFENGRANVHGSVANHRVFEMSWNGSTADQYDIDNIIDYYNGEYGTGLIHFVDPMEYERNLFPPNWASPALYELGDWKNIYTVAPSFSTTSTNSYLQPKRKATYSITTASAAIPTASTRMVIPIPPTHTLRLGYSGAVTGTGVVQVRPIKTDGTYDTVSNLTPLTDTASTRLNATYAGSTYIAAEIYLTRTSSATSTVTITSMMAQLWTTGVTPTLTGNHIRGRGFVGCKFLDAALPMDYTMTDRRVRSMSTSLIEVDV